MELKLVLVLITILNLTRRSEYWFTTSGNGLDRLKIFQEGEVSGGESRETSLKKSINGCIKIYCVNGTTTNQKLKIYNRQLASTLLLSIQENVPEIVVCLGT